MLAFWGIFDRTAYHLAALGVVSVAIAYALYSTSRWAFWLGFLTFPLLVAEFLYALIASVNFTGWTPNLPTSAFHTSLITYVIFLVLSLILLIDKRNTLRTDRILDRLSTLAKPSEKSDTPTS